MSKPRKTKALCAGCHNQCYHHGTGGAKVCWSYKDATVKRRVCVYYMQENPAEHCEAVWALSCFRQVNGSFYYDNAEHIRKAEARAREAATR